MGDIAVRAEGISKSYQIGMAQERYRNFRDAIVDGVTGPFKRVKRLLSGDSYGAAESHEEFWALRDIGFEIKHGEVVGIIGRNGAGKSTLLKILSRITEPTGGYADIYGRVGALLEVGTGFHPELTGRENILLNGTILGMRQAEIKRKFDEIVAFAEVEQFIDTPVKHYSSGMGLRLGFAVAAHLEPEILIVDEVLAVGDASFQKKCLGKMSAVAGEGRTVLFVSHNMAAVQSLCSRGIVLSGGKIDSEGSIDTVVQRYLALGNDISAGEISFVTKDEDKQKTAAHFTKARLLRNETIVSSIEMGDDVTVELEFEASSRVTHPYFSVRLYTALNQDVAVWRSNETHGEIPPFTGEGGKMRLNIDRLDLMPGTYFFAIGLSSASHKLDYIPEALKVEITPRPIYATGMIPKSRSAIMYAPCSWNFEYR